MGMSGSTAGARSPMATSHLCWIPPLIESGSGARTLPSYQQNGCRRGRPATSTRSTAGSVCAPSARHCRCMPFRRRVPPTSRALLHERHLVSKELAGLETQHPLRTGAAVFLADGLGVMVNEEDQLRLQVIRSGLSLEEAWREIDRFDDALDRDAGHTPEVDRTFAAKARRAGRLPV